MLTVSTATFAGSLAASSLKRLVCASHTGVSSEGTTLSTSVLPAKSRRLTSRRPVGPALVELEVGGAVARLQLRARDGQRVATHLHRPSGHGRLLPEGNRADGTAARRRRRRATGSRVILPPRGRRGAAGHSCRRGRGDSGREARRIRPRARGPGPPPRRRPRPAASSGGPTCHSARYASSPPRPSCMATRSTRSWNAGLERHADLAAAVPRRHQHRNVAPVGDPDRRHGSSLGAASAGHAGGSGVDTRRPSG